jgi:hypothetical protein
VHLFRRRYDFARQERGVSASFGEVRGATERREAVVVALLVVVAAPQVTPATQPTARSQVVAAAVEERTARVRRGAA